MKRTLLLPALLALGFGICVVAQTEADYSGWMKDVAATKGKVGKAVAAKQNEEVATGATHLAGLFKQVGAFFTGRNMSDAASIAQSAASASSDLAAAAKAGDDAKIASSMQEVNAACGTCHAAHRGGTAGSYTIK